MIVPAAGADYTSNQRKTERHAGRNISQKRQIQTAVGMVQRLQSCPAPGIVLPAWLRACCKFGCPASAGESHRARFFQAANFFQGCGFFAERPRLALSKTRLLPISCEQPVRRPESNQTAGKFPLLGQHPDKSLLRRSKHGQRDWDSLDRAITSDVCVSQPVRGRRQQIGGVFHDMNGSGLRQE